MRRESLWFSLAPVASAIAAASTAVLTNSLNAAALALRPFTVVRTRGSMMLASDQTSAIETYAASFGFCVVSDQASAIGVTAVPTPATDRGSDLWFVYESMAGRLQLATNVGFETAGRELQFDSKAMRKVEDGSDVVVVQETEAISNGVVLITSARMLVKLH